MFSSTPSDTGRDPWPDGGRTGPAGPPRGRAPRGYPSEPGSDGPPYGDNPRRPRPEDDLRRGPSATGPWRDPAPVTGGQPPAPAGRRDRGGRGRARRGEGAPASRAADAPEVQEEVAEEIPAVPIRRLLSLSIAGFAALLGVGLVAGAQTAGPGHRLPFAIVVFGVQLLFILAWTMAMRPPALLLVAGVSVGVAAAADAAAVLPTIAGLAPLGYVAVAGFVVGVLGQLIRPADRTRVTESLGATLLIVVGVVAFGALIVLSRRPSGTQAIFVCLTAAAVALAVARLVDAVLPRPRLAPQVPRGGAGVVIGAMCGTLASAVIGSYLVRFNPTGAALVGLMAAATAVLADLAVGYSEAGRQMAGEPPTMWIARHMQGPLGGFALAAPAAYAITVFFL